MALAGIAIFSIVTLLYLFLPLHSLGLYLPLNPNEGWNALQSERALGSGTLYPASGAFFFNNYPPLSFYVVGLLGQVVGDNIIAGRLVSLMSMFAIAANIAWIVCNLGGTRIYAIFAGVLFLGILSKSYTLYVGVNDPQLLAHAVMTAGFAVFTADRADPRRIAFAALIMVTAGMIKHNILAMPLAITTWLMVHDRKAAQRWVIYAVLWLAIALAVCAAAYGPAFFEQLRSPRVYSLYRIVALLGWTQGFIIPLIVWGIFAGKAPRDPRLSLVTHLVVAGGIAYAVTRIGEGVSINSLFDWIIGASIAAGVALSRLDEMRGIERYGVSRMRTVIIVALCARLILLPQKELLNIAFGTDLATTQELNRVAQLDIALMRQFSGPAICEDLTLCYWSGHQSAYDGFNAGQAFLTGARDIDLLRSQIRSGQFPLIQLEPASPLLEAARNSGFTERTGASGRLIFTAPRS